jgi:FkbM family methyltransferase
MNFGDSNQATNGEMWLLDHLADEFDSAPVVFDVGANVGAYSRAVLERIPSAHLFSFEPSRTAFTELETALSQRAVVRRVALAEEDAQRPLWTDSPGSELASLTRRDLHRFRLEMNTSEMVELRRLDDLCAELEIARIDLLKIDTEGGDLAVLRGAGDMLGARVDVIQFEFGGTAIDTGEPLRSYFDLLEPAYRIHRLLPDGLRPLEYNERLEVAVYANYVAVKRD